MVTRVKGVLLYRVFCVCSLLRNKPTVRRTAHTTRRLPTVLRRVAIKYTPPGKVEVVGSGVTPQPRLTSPLTPVKPLCLRGSRVAQNALRDGCRLVLGALLRRELLEDLLERRVRAHCRVWWRCLRAVGVVHLQEPLARLQPELLLACVGQRWWNQLYQRRRPAKSSEHPRQCLRGPMGQPASSFPPPYTVPVWEA